MKLLTIVIPVYNTEAYLRRCLDSVLFPEVLDSLEVIIVNDGSKDGSSSIAHEYQVMFPQSVICIDKENGGHGSTINAGLKIAQGKYFRVLDSDDWLDSLAFKSFMHDLALCDEDLIVSPYTQEYVFNGAVIEFKYDWLKPGVIYYAEDMICTMDKMYFTIHSSTFKTSVLRQSGLMLYEHCFYVDMQYIFFPVPYLRSFRLINYPLYRYFIGRPEQSMAPAVAVRNLPQHERVMRWMIDYYVENNKTVLSNVKEYMAMIIYLMYNTHVDLICRKLTDQKLAYKMIRDIEKYLQDKDFDLWQRMSNWPYIACCRKRKYLNVRFKIKN